MNFFRENLFLVLLTTGTLVACLILVLWSGAIASQIDEVEIADRQDLSDALERLARPPYDNGNTNMAEQNRVEGIRKSLKKVGNENLAWNSRNFKVPQLTMLDGTKRPAFPFDANVWVKNQLADRFLAQYHEQYDAMLASMKPVTPPTEEELAEEIQRWEKTLEQRQRILEKEKTGEDSTQPSAAATGAPRPTAPAPMGAARYNPARIPPEGPSYRTTGSFRTEAEKRAREILRVRKAQSGAVYANDTAFQLEFPRGILIGSSDVNAEKFWNAQVGIWVRSDIVNAINDAIQTAWDQQKLSPNQRNVITSPIKRLVEIKVGDSDPTAKKTAYARRPVEPLMGQEEYSHSYMQRPTGKFSQSPRPTRTTVAPTVRPDTLTQRAPDKIADVVNYEFTVLMPTRHIRLLEKSLLKRNYHVILDMQIDEPDATSSSSGSSRLGGGTQTTTEGLYYYGVEPVSKVIISGQLLLMSDFTRGRWDSEKKQWLREPLMPVENIRELPPAALRTEDRQLIEGRLPQPWNPAAPKPKAEPPRRDTRYGGRRPGYR
ncbi:MAG: hypothetical protein JW849_10450 [Phycisphaerae bacterium]|nr:hypothetical protein [Phycisphaerae bacterium]